MHMDVCVSHKLHLKQTVSKNPNVVKSVVLAFVVFLLCFFVCYKYSNAILIIHCFHKLCMYLLHGVKEQGLQSCVICQGSTVCS